MNVCAAVRGRTWSCRRYLKCVLSTGDVPMARRSPLKARPLRNPGQSADEALHQLVENKADPVLLASVLVWLLAIMEWHAWLTERPPAPWPLTILALITTAGAAFFLVRVRRRVKNLKQGRDGEIAVAQYLDGLREDGARIFHDVPGGNFNLDHVVISRHGIVAVETKTLTKPDANARITFDDDGLLVAGRRPDRDYLAQVSAQIDWLRRLLKESTGKDLPVRGALVFPGWWVDPAPASRRRGVWVLEPKALPDFLQNEPLRLENADVALAAYHLSRYIRTH